MREQPPSLDLLIDASKQIALPNNTSIQRQEDLLFQIGWRAKEISWVDKYNKLDIISERTWRILENIPRYLIEIESSMHRDNLIRSLAAGVKTLHISLRNFQGIYCDKTHDSSNLHDNFLAVENCISICNLKVLVLEINQLLVSKIDVKQEFHVNALLKIIEQAGEYFKWLSSPFSNYFDELPVDIAKIRDLAIHKKNRLRKLCTCNEILNAALTELVTLKDSISLVLEKLNRMPDIPYLMPTSDFLNNSPAVKPDYPAIKGMRNFLADSVQLKFTEVIAILTLVLDHKQKKILNFLSGKTLKVGDKVDTYFKLTGFNQLEIQQIFRWVNTPRYTIQNQGELFARIEQTVQHHNNNAADKMNVGKIKGLLSQIKKQLKKDVDKAEAIFTKTLRIDEAEWRLIVQQTGGIVPLPISLDLEEILARLWPDLDTEKKRVLLRELRSRIGELVKEVHLQKQVSTSSESYLLAHCSTLLMLNNDQKQLLDLLLRKVKLANDRDFDSLLLQLNINRNDIQVILNPPGQMYHRHIFRYLKFDKKYHDNAPTYLILEQIEALARMLADSRDMSNDPFYIDRIFTESPVYYLAAKKLFEDLEETITEQGFRDDASLIKYFGNKITFRHFILLKQFRNMIAHRPEEITPMQLVWFFKKWVVDVSADIQWLTTVSSGATSTVVADSNSSIVEVNDIADLVKAADLIRAMVTSFGCESDILVRGHLLHNTIGNLRHLNLIVTPSTKSRVWSNDLVYEIQSNLSMVLSCSVSVTTFDLLSQSIGVTITQSQFQDIKNEAKDLRLLQFYFDKKSALSEGWYELTFSGIKKAVTFKEREKNPLIENEIDKIQTIVSYYSDALIEKEKSKRTSLINKTQVAEVINAKARTYANILHQAIDALNEKDRVVLLGLHKRSFRLCKKLDVYFMQNRKRIFEINSSITKYHFRHAVMQNVQGFRENCSLGQQLIQECDAFQRELVSYFSNAPTIKLMGSGIGIIDFGDIGKQQDRIYLEGQYNQLLQLLDEVFDVEIVNYFIGNRNGIDYLAHHINQYFIQRFMDPLESDIEILTINGRNYYKQSFFQEVMQEVAKSMDPEYILSNPINMICRSKIQYYIRGKTEAPESSGFTIESYAQHIGERFEGKQQAINTMLREYSYPEVRTLDQLLARHNLAREEYLDYQEDAPRFDHYMQVVDLINNLRNLEKILVRSLLNMLKKGNTVLSTQNQFPAIDNMTIIIQQEQERARIELLQQAQHRLCVELFCSNYVQEQFNGHPEQSNFIKILVRELTEDLMRTVKKSLGRLQLVGTDFITEYGKRRQKELEAIFSTVASFPIAQQFNSSLRMSPLLSRKFNNFLSQQPPGEALSPIAPNDRQFNFDEEYDEDMIDKLLNPVVIQKLSGFKKMDSVTIMPVSYCGLLRHSDFSTVRPLGERLKIIDDILFTDQPQIIIFPTCMSRHYFLVVLMLQERTITPFYVHSINTPLHNEIGDLKVFPENPQYADDDVIKEVRSSMQNRKYAGRSINDLVIHRFNQQTALTQKCGGITVQNAIDIATGRITLDISGNIVGEPSIVNPSDADQYIRDQRAVLSLNLSVPPEVKSKEANLSATMGLFSPTTRKAKYASGVNSQEVQSTKGINEEQRLAEQDDIKVEFLDRIIQSTKFNETLIELDGEYSEEEGLKNLGSDEEGQSAEELSSSGEKGERLDAPGQFI